MITTGDRWTDFVARIQRGERAPFTEHSRIFREAYADAGMPPTAWRPDEATRERSNLLALQKELDLEDYPALHRFSVDQRDEFWSRVLKRLGIAFAREPETVLDSTDDVRHPRWLRGAKLEITRSCFLASGDETAIIYGREGDDELARLSYAELEKRVDRFAGGLCARGFEPDDGVALYMPMTPECVVAYLGTIRAGCRVVSIADSFSADELERRMRIAAVKAIVTISAYERAGREIDLYSKVRDAAGRFELPPFAIVIEPRELHDGDVPWLEFQSDETPEAFVGEPQHVTNVLFSSGTTGEPKAIPWTELTPLKAAMDAHFHHDVHEEDNLCWPTNIGWMMGPWLVYASLVNRATMSLYEGAPTSRGFTNFVREAGVSVLGVVPAIVRHWRANESVGAGDFPNVRLFTSTGEASNSEDYLWLMSRADYRAPVIEYLGGTEIGGGHLAGTVLQPASPSTFTTPALGLDVVLVDEEGEIVTGEGMGELFLVPPSIGLSQELLNKDHDVVYYDGCPSGPEGEVLRRHGDQIARLANGYFKAQGRADDTMNLGGIKVGSLELERVVNEHPSVYESAAVAVQPEGEGADRLVVFVVLQEGTGDVSVPELKKGLGRRIGDQLNPLFKIHDVVVVDSLPRTASNKIMRRRLRSGYR